MRWNINSSKRPNNVEIKWILFRLGDVHWEHNTNWLWVWAENVRIGEKVNAIKSTYTNGNAIWEKRKKKCIWTIKTIILIFNDQFIDTIEKFSVQKLIRKIAIILILNASPSYAWIISFCQWCHEYIEKFNLSSSSFCVRKMVINARISFPLRCDCLIPTTVHVYTLDTVNLNIITAHRSTIITTHHNCCIWTLMKIISRRCLGTFSVSLESKVYRPN